MFSSNYELYGDLTGRVMAVLSQEAPEYFRYSIDEAFVILRGMEQVDLKEWGEQLHRTIKQRTGIPVSIGIAATKTLAKMASYYAKHYAGYKHCCLIDNEEKRLKALKLYPIDEVWGIGRRYAARLEQLNVRAAYDLASSSPEWVYAAFKNIVVMRTWKELNGIDCVPNDEPAKKKSICVSRSFPGMVGDLEQLKTYVSNYASRCSEKLRKQHTLASVVGVFLSTNPFRMDLSQYSNFGEITLLTPTSNSIDIVQKANECLTRLYRSGYQYKRAGVVVISMEGSGGIQTNFLDFDAERFQKMKALDTVVDRINKLKGSDTVIIGAQQFPGKDSQGKAQSGISVPTCP